MQSWNVIGLVPGEKSCNCSEQFGKRAVLLLRQREIQLSEHVDGGRYGKNFVQLDDVGVPVGPRVSQVQDLKSRCWCEAGGQRRQ